MKTQNTIDKAQTKHKFAKSQSTNVSKGTNHYRDLEERTTEFAKRIVRLCKALPQNTINRKLIDQIVRSSGSIGANYREANESFTKKDFHFRLRIARKEAKETSYWLELVEEANPDFRARMQALHQEVQELRNIISAIVAKASSQ